MAIIAIKGQKAKIGWMFAKSRKNDAQKVIKIRLKNSYYEERYDVTNVLK